MRTSGLPIDEALGPLTAALANHPAAVLQAPPGAGKSTVVPLALLPEPWVRGQRILMLEPRRLAARAVATRMAATLGETVGQRVGYRMRMETRVSRDTRIEVITEGILTRMLQSDPALEGVAAVIFDEFHERSLSADLGLALTLDARENLSPDLKILVMSATLDGEAVARLLGDAPLVTSEGRVFPVETRFAARGAPLLPGGPPGQESPERVVAQLVLRALAEEAGDVLVFLPGAREIRRVQGTLEAAGLERTVHVLPLYGELGPQDQDAALAPAPAGQRKVVLSTNIAETSLTLPGVRVVVDSGLVRRAAFDPSTGMSRLTTQRVSRASAQQRQGRAGRLTAGVCYRAWSEEAHRSLAPFSAPEILDADLVPLALELSAWGTLKADELRWLDPPPTAQLASARDVLRSLGALDEAGRITAHGREMLRIGAHPRLAHMLLSARPLGALPAAAELAALLSERDLLRGAGGLRDADIRSRLSVLRGETPPGGVDRGVLQRVRRASRELAREAGGSSPPPRAGEEPSVGVLLAFAYPDRIGRRRAGPEARFTLANGRGAHFADAQGVARGELIVAVDLDDRERDARILLAAPLTRAELTTHFGGRIQTRASVEWVSREQAVRARRLVQLDSLVLEESPLPQIPAEAAAAAMLTGVREMGINSLPWEDESRSFQARVELVRKLDSKTPWPDLSDNHLAGTLEHWLAPWLTGVTRREHLVRLSLIEILQGQLSYAQLRELGQLAPTHIGVPSGSQVRIDYLADRPAVAVRLQEVFGLEETPRIVHGRVPLTFHLLSPARRPVQVTGDLASFWRGAYAEVRKDLRGRYPRHHWPENPLEATATRGVRPRR